MPNEKSQRANLSRNEAQMEIKGGYNGPVAERGNNGPAIEKGNNGPAPANTTPSANVSSPAPPPKK